MHNSTIKRKKCKCSDTCDKFPSIGYKGYFSGHLPQEIKDADPEKFKRRAISIRKRVKINYLSRKVHSYQLEGDNQKNELKSALLKKADNLFSKFIRKRDADAKGFVTCPCCKKTYHIREKNSSGDVIIQTLHFVPRTVYSRRFCTRNCYGGCFYCNKKQHDDPYGETYQQFKEFLYGKIGVEAVWMMEAERRNINKLSHGDLEDIIKKYK